MTLANTIKKTALEHVAAWQACSQPVTKRWLRHAIGSYKINFDTAICDHFLAQSIVCQDSNGCIIKALYQINPPCHPTFGEALAAHLASSLAISLKLHNFTLEEDSSAIIMALSRPSIVED